MSKFSLKILPDLIFGCGMGVQEQHGELLLYRSMHLDGGSFRHLRTSVGKVSSATMLSSRPAIFSLKT
ncbi:hypothetical protein FMM74_021180 [Lachnospiraceae bacterium MD308]|nr:hypothetical protein [Lachnospiraceae bacterium MD308]